MIWRRLTRQKPSPLRGEGWVGVRDAAAGVSVHRSEPQHETAAPITPIPALPPSRGKGKMLVHALASLSTAGVLLFAPVAQAQSPLDTPAAEPQPILDTEINDILHKEFDPVFVAAGLNRQDV